MEVTGAAVDMAPQEPMSTVDQEENLEEAQAEKEKGSTEQTMDKGEGEGIEEPEAVGTGRMEIEEIFLVLHFLLLYQEG